MREDFSTSPESPVLVIGTAGVDIVGRLKYELKLGTSNPGQVRTSFGGVARNVAENLARLGQEVILVSAVGSDEIGEQLVEETKRAGVDTENILRTRQFPTGAYLGVVDQNGVMQFALDDMRASNTLTPEHLKQNTRLFKDASALFLDANLPKETIRTAISLAKRADIPVCADPTSAALAGRLRTHLNDIALITPNSIEAGVLWEHTFEASRSRQAMQAAKYLVSQGVRIALITMAEFGVCYVSSETSGHIPAIRTKILDPTGAGDALNATVIFALLNDIPLDDAVRLGVSAASLTLRYPGSVVPTLSLEVLYDQLVI